MSTNVYKEKVLLFSAKMLTEQGTIIINNMEAKKMDKPWSSALRSLPSGRKKYTYRSKDKLMQHILNANIIFKIIQRKTFLSA